VKHNLCDFKKKPPICFSFQQEKKSTAATDILPILLQIFMITIVNFQYKGTKTETCNRIETSNLTEHQLLL